MVWPSSLASECLLGRRSLFEHLLITRQSPVNMYHRLGLEGLITFKEECAFDAEKYQITLPASTSGLNKGTSVSAALVVLSRHCAQSSRAEWEHVAHLLNRPLCWNGDVRRAQISPLVSLTNVRSRSVSRKTSRLSVAE